MSACACPDRAHAKDSHTGAVPTRGCPAQRACLNGSSLQLSYCTGLELSRDIGFAVAQGCAVVRCMSSVPQVRLPVLGRDHVWIRAKALREGVGSLRAIYINKYRRDIRRVKLGFSWTVLFGGTFTLVIRRQWKMAAASLAATFASLYLLGLFARFPAAHLAVGTAALSTHLWLSCKANELLLASLEQNDYVLLDDYARMVQRTLGAAVPHDQSQTGDLQS